MHQRKIDKVKKECLSLLTKEELIKRIIDLEQERRRQDRYILACKQRVFHFKQVNQKMNRLTPVLENNGETQVVRIWKPKVF